MQGGGVMRAYPDNLSAQLGKAADILRRHPSEVYGLEQLCRETAAALREQGVRIAELERHRDDATLMLGFADICAENGLMPSSGELLAASKRTKSRLQVAAYLAGWKDAQERAVEVAGAFGDRDGTDKEIADNIRALTPGPIPKEWGGQ